MLSCRHRVCAAGFAVLVLAARAHAEPGRATDQVSDPDARKEAARRFAEGTRAFDAGDFTQAGEAFEAAYRLEHHADPLWNAARAWHHAGEFARAANLYARYLREAPATAPDRASATAALNQIAPRVAQIEMHLGPGVEGASVDDAPVDFPIVFVAPGMHSVRARGATGEIERRQALDPGARVSVLLVSAPSIAVVSPPPRPSLDKPATSPMDREFPSTGWSPIVVVVEGGLTVGVAGLAIWSGLETLGTLHAFRNTLTQASLDTGRFQEERTNVLIGTSVGLAALTAITAVWLIDWRGRHRPVGASFGPGFAAVSGSF